MAEVGVLNLTIHDNSEEAGKGLDHLADALSKVKENSAGFSLNGVSVQIKKIVDGVKENTKVVSELGKLFNGLAQFGKIKSLSIPVDQFAALKDAINGMSIGQTGTQLENIRKALGGEWKTENIQDAMQAMNAVQVAAAGWQSAGTAKSITDVANAIREYTTAVNSAPKDSPFSIVLNSMQTDTSKMSVVTGQIKEEIEKAADFSDELRNIFKKTKSSVKMSLDEFGGLQKFASKGTRQSEGQTMMDLDGLMPSVDGLIAVQETIERTTSVMDGFSESLKRTGETARDTNLDQYIVSPIESLLDRFNHCADAAETVKRSFDEVESSAHMLGAQAVISSGHIEALQRRLNADISWKGMNQMVDQLVGVRKNFLDAKEAAEVFISSPIEDINIELRETGDIIESIVTNKFQDMYQMFGDLAHRAGWFKKETMRLMEGPDIHRAVSPENMLSTYVDKWTPDWTFADPAIFDAYIEKIQQMYAIWSQFSYEFHAFQMEGMRIASGSSPFLLGDGKTPGQLLLGDGSEPETFLSTWVDAGEQWTQNWVEYSSEAAQAMRDAWKPDWSFLDEGIDKAKMVETALHMVEEAKKQLLEKIEKGEISKKDALGIASQIEEFEKRIPIVQEEIKQVTSTAAETTGELWQWGDAIDNSATKMKNMSDVVDHQAYRIEHARKTFANSSDAVKQTIAETLGMTKEELFGGIENIQRTETSLQSMNNTIRDVKSATSGTTPELKNLDKELKQKKEDVDNVKTGFERFKDSLAHVKSGVKTLFSPLTRLGKQFWNIAKRMAIRAVIRQFTSGLKEGVENVYYYSKAIGSDFAPSMDSAATSLQQMKNSLGAAIAPVLQSLIPVLQSVVNWFIEMLNHANQFFALMNGQSTWVRAVPATTTAFGKEEKAAKKAGNAIKDLLADWDELNIIQSNSSGSGTGSSTDKATEALNMFETMTTFDNKIRDVVGFIKDNFDTIKDVVLAIGEGILLWKFSKAFLSDLSGLKSLELLAGLTLLIGGIKLGIDAATQVGYTNGQDKDAILQSVMTLAADALGGFLIGNAVGGLAGGAVGAVVGLGIGLYTQITAYINGVNLRLAEQKALKLRERFGGTAFSPESIKNYIEQQLTFDLSATVNILSAKVKSMDEARESLQTAVGTLKSSIEKRKVEIRLGIERSEDNQTLIDEANEIITQINTTQKANLVALEAQLQITPLTDGEGNVLSASGVLDTVMAGQKVYRDYMADIGREFVKALTGGFDEELGKINAEKYAMELGQKLVDIELGTQKYYQEAKIAIELGLMTDADFTNMDLDSAKEMIKQQQAKLEELKGEFIETQKTAQLGYAQELASAKAVWDQNIKDYGEGWKDTDEGKALKGLIDTYEQLITEMSDYEGSWEKISGDAVTKMKNQWIELFRSKGTLSGPGTWLADNETFGVRNSVNEFLEFFNKNRNRLENPKLFNSLFGSALSWFGTDLSIGDARRSEIFGGYEGLPYEVSKALGISELDMMTSEQRAKIVGYFKSIYDDDNTIVKYLKELGVSTDTIKTAFKEYEELQEELKQTALKSTQAAYNNNENWSDSNVEEFVKNYLRDEPQWIIDYVIGNINRNRNPYRDRPLEPDDTEYIEKYDEYFELLTHEDITESERLLAELIGGFLADIMPENTTDITDAMEGKDFVSYARAKVLDKLLEGTGVSDPAKALKELEYIKSTGIKPSEEWESTIEGAVVSAIQETGTGNTSTGHAWVDWNNQIQTDLPGELSNAARQYIGMVVDAMNSGEGREAVEQAVDSAMADIEVFAEALPYINELTELWRRMYEKVNAGSVAGGMASGMLEGLWQMMDNNPYFPDRYGYFGSTRKFNPYMVTGSAGMSDVGWNFRRMDYEEPDTSNLYYPEDDFQEREYVFDVSQEGFGGSGAGEESTMAGDVEKGFRAASEGFETQLNTMIQLMRALLNKRNSVEFVPTSAMGQGVSASLAAWGSVTGNN